MSPPPTQPAQTHCITDQSVVRIFDQYDRIHDRDAFPGRAGVGHRRNGGRRLRHASGLLREFIEHDIEHPLYSPFPYIIMDIRTS